MHVWLFKMKVTPIVSSYAGNEKSGNKGKIKCITNWSTVTDIFCDSFFDHTCNWELLN